jgi:hypothetical protein
LGALEEENERTVEPLVPLVVASDLARSDNESVVISLRRDEQDATDDDDEAVIPWSQTVRFPSREEWAEVSKRISESILKSEGGDGLDEDPEVLSIQRKLETMKIEFSFENTKLDAILDYIRDFSGLTILLDPAVSEKVDKPIPLFRLKDLALKNALKHLLDQFGLGYHITEKKVIFITDPKKAGGGNVLELHDIRDILVKLQDFAGPKVELVSAAAGAGGPLAGAAFTLDEPKQLSVGEEQILELIKENIFPGTWDGDQTIEKTPTSSCWSTPPRTSTATCASSWESSAATPARWLP